MAPFEAFWPLRSRCRRSGFFWTPFRLPPPAALGHGRWTPVVFVDCKSNPRADFRQWANGQELQTVLSTQAREVPRKEPLAFEACL